MLGSMTFGMKPPNVSNDGIGLISRADLRAARSGPPRTGRQFDRMSLGRSESGEPVVVHAVTGAGIRDKPSVKVDHIISRVVASGLRLAHRGPQ